MRLIKQEDVESMEKKGHSVKMVKGSGQPVNSSVIIQSPSVSIDHSTKVSENVLKNIEGLLLRVIESIPKEFPAPVVNVAAPNVEVSPPAVNIENKASDVKFNDTSRHIEILLKELVLQKKQPIEVTIDSDESDGWDSIKFTITRDEKGFMKEVTAKKGD
jgi:hypothetical protein